MVNWCTRARNKWKFHLKDGVMNLEGRDYTFQVRLLLGCWPAVFVLLLLAIIFSSYFSSW